MDGEYFTNTHIQAQHEQPEKLQQIGKKIYFKYIK